MVGTRITDGDGIEWVRAHSHGGPAPWMRVTPVLDELRDTWSVWSAIKPPVTTAPTTRTPEESPDE